jgi:hypothetical protein
MSFPRYRPLSLRWLMVAACLCCGLPFLQFAAAQSAGAERTFPQSKSTIEKILKEMQASTAGRLPVLDGFANPGEHPLERYQRGYYQSKFQVSPAANGGCVVRVNVEVTAWYADPAGAHSGYQLLPSNGRLEADMLDQLAEQIAGKAPQPEAEPSTVATRGPVPSRVSPSPPSTATDSAATALTASGPAANAPATTKPKPLAPPPAPASKPAASKPTPSEPAISAPVPQIPNSGGYSVAQGLSAQDKPATGVDSNDRALRAEAESLEEILKSQAHPKNLVAVKKSGTPVVEAASLTAKTLFLASAHDEFEMLDFNRDWVHVRISGISRGWIWRNSLEMPDSIPEGEASANPSPVAADMFHVSREETAQFPGDWAPLRGKNVKIVSVETADESVKSGPQLRLEYVKSLLDKNYAELAQKSSQLAGIVIIFDSVDGGMIAAPFTVLQQWKAGNLSDAALWHQCFFDPPETFNASTDASTASSTE